MTKLLLNTLFVGTEGTYLRLDNDQIIAEAELEISDGTTRRQTLLKVPIHHIGSIVLFGRVTASFPLLARCAEDGRGFTLMNEFGRFLARVQGKTTGNVLLRKAQHAHHSEAEPTLTLAKMIVAAKLQNSRQVIMRGARDATSNANKFHLEHAGRAIAEIITLLPEADEIDEVRGLEGMAAQHYFGVFDSMITSQRTDFKFTVRTRRPPRDRVNCLLSFLYSLWTNDCVAALEGVGLDPQMGYLHVLRPGRPALALDLVEEFRSVILDRLCLTLINRKQISAEDIEIRRGGSVSLTADGRKKVLHAYQLRKQVEVRHPLFKEKVPIGLLAHVQARLLARYLRGDTPQYTPYQP